MAETETTTTETVVADDAERARAAADAASAAATQAAALAATEAANVQQQASERVAKLEAEAESWRGMQSRHDELERRVLQADERMQKLDATLTGQLQSILSRLEPPPEPQKSPDLNPPPDDGKKSPAPEPEKQPERRRAHRWI